MTENPLPSRDATLYKAVSSQIGAIQARRADGNRHPDIDARLARLRRAVLLEPGTVPEIWTDTVGCLPDGLRFGVGPSPWECSIHEAMTMYALHQQSKGTAVHKKGISLGTAAQRLVPTADRDNPNPIRTRFHALSMSQTRDSAAHHLRALIALLRTADEPLDYGTLAVDLRQLQDPLRMNSVRLRWGRAFARVTNMDPDSSTGSPNANSASIEI